MKLLCLFVLATVFAAGYACQADGVEHKDGEEWIVKDHFVQKCTFQGLGWSIKTIACQLPDGTRFAPGETLQGNACNAKENGLEIRLPRVQTSTCGDHKEDEEWKDGNFRRKCENKVAQFVGCYVTEQDELIKVGDETTSGNFTFQCVADGEGEKQHIQLVVRESGPTPPIKRRVVRSVRRKKAGPPAVAPPGFEAFLPKEDEEGRAALQCQGHQHGEEWDVNVFRARCENGKTVWVSCRRNGVNIPIDQVRTVGNFEYRCARQGRGIRLEPAGSVLKIVAEPTSCDGHREGERWRQGSFERRCEHGEIRFVGCFKDDQFLDVGERRRFAGRLFECRITGTTVQLEPL